MSDSANRVMTSLGSLHKKVDSLNQRVDKINGNVRANTTDVAVLDATVMTTAACSDKQNEMASVIGDRVLEKITARSATFWQRFGATVISGIAVAIIVAVILRVAGV